MYKVNLVTTVVDIHAGYVPDYTTPRDRLGLGDWCTGCHFTYIRLARLWFPGRAL